MSVRPTSSLQALSSPHILRNPHKVTLPTFTASLDIKLDFHDLFIWLVNENTGIPSMQKLFHLIRGLTTHVFSSFELSTSIMMSRWIFLKIDTTFVN